MSNVVSSYIVSIQKELSTGHAQEHSYRPALKTLFEKTTKLKVINEPKGSAHGRPDFIFVKGEIPLAWVEAKDLHVNLEKIEKSEQMERYFGYANLILTNGLEFRFYKNGKRYGDPIGIATKKENTLTSVPGTHDSLIRVLEDFTKKSPDTIRSTEHLAKIMGGKARRIRDNITDMLDPSFTGNKGDIENVMQVLKTKLLKDLTPTQFADLYAQTLVYGLFAARYNDDSKDTFSREEAREKIPAGNHLLQQFFDHIAGANFVKKLSYIVDELCEVFVHADVKSLVHGLFQKESDTHDPIIHFYEDFLKEYDPELRMQRGVYYTPLPVVRYIVRSVDAILKEHFGLKEGLADRSFIDHEYQVQAQKKKGVKKIPRVQILDPAVGTGTFLNEVIREVHKKFEGQEGMWSSFVHDHLIPRLNGFELMMASYTIAHLKLSMTLAETGIKDIQQRLRVFLTNSLEEAPLEDGKFPLPGLGLSGALTEEAEQAAEVKRDYPIMVVMGNPPYSVSSSNKSDWIDELTKTYKEGLKEKSYNALSDDYVKFIRFAHHLIEKNEQGVIAMITNNSFLDGLVHRRMRESLLTVFDNIYVINLHGNSKKKEVCPDGSKDENVFDIQQGVGVSLFVKTERKSKKLGTLYHLDLWGLREKKYEWLENHDVLDTEWKQLAPVAPSYFFVPKDFGLKKKYDEGIQLNTLFKISAAGIKTHRDTVVISFKGNEMKEQIMSFDANHDYDQNKVTNIIYRPFDIRMIYYDTDLVTRHRYEKMKHAFKPNISLIMGRQTKNREVDQYYVTSGISEMKTAESSTGSYQFPLYIYPDSTTVDGDKRISNLDMKLLKPVLNQLILTWAEDGIGDGKKTCGPEDIFDYIYAVLHSPSYRERYKEFLKIDFPRVPFTSNAKLFWSLVKLGREIRLLHLLESPKLEKLVTKYPVAGSNIVEKVKYDEEKKRVFINAEQYFEGIEPEVWAFPIGGYHPLQKWLKDRKGRELSSDDILHWQKVVVALKETGKLMREIDEEVKEAGGWPMV